jgi:hypothetical protein
MVSTYCVCLLSAGLLSPVPIRCTVLMKYCELPATSWRTRDAISRLLTVLHALTTMNTTGKARGGPGSKQLHLLHTAQYTVQQLHTTVQQH